MRNFHKIAERIDVMPALHQARLSGLWDAHPIRTTFQNSPHSAVSDILLRFNRLDQLDSAVVDDTECVPFEGWDKLPQARALAFDVMARVEAVRLGRVMITRLPPGGRITPHTDQGAPASYYERYHIALQGLPGSLFHCGGETVQMLSGECWHVDNQREHSVENNSADDRIHLIVDARLA